MGWVGWGLGVLHLIKTSKEILRHMGLMGLRDLLKVPCRYKIPSKYECEPCDCYSGTGKVRVFSD